MGAKHPKIVWYFTDTYHQEVEALENLSSAFGAMIKTEAMQYLKAEIISHTVFAALMTALAPVAWLKVGKIIGKPMAQFTFPFNH